MTLRAVFFDAVGTLIHPEPDFVVAYRTIGERHGSRKSPDEIRRRFHEAFRLQEEIDARAGHRTDEERERRRWREIVSHVFDDLADSSACFEELWRHFAQPASWRCDPEAGETLDSLASRGIVLGVASNFDGRLHDVVRGLPALAPVSRFVVSSLAGWKKPAAPFYAAVSREAQAPPHDILFVGDDPANDYQAPMAAGFQAALLSPGKPNAAARHIASLRQLTYIADEVVS